MSRDPGKLKVFALADELAVLVYRATRKFPAEERFGLRAQIRRASVSVPANIVEGSARRSLRDYLHFLVIALGSASEAQYLLGLAARLELLEATSASELGSRYGDLVRALQAMIDSLEERA
jgi:four helix bundle protein